MADTNVPIPNLPEHIEETVRSIAQLHADHNENATLLERALDRATAFISRPWGLGLITVIVVGWVCLNLVAAAFGVRPIDPPPFLLLGGAVSLVSLFIIIVGWS
jgi:uncharacterized membrane protein